MSKSAVNLVVVTEGATKGSITEVSIDDLLWAAEFEIGHEEEEMYEYADGHIETGRTRYTGRKERVRASEWEYTLIPVLEALTPLSCGLVKIIR